MAAFNPYQYESIHLRWQHGGSTNIGGSSENQDDMFIWERPDKGLCVIGVLDGHGRDVGKLAAVSGRKFLLEFFDKYHDELLVTPYECLLRAHVGAHSQLKEAFKEALSNQGWGVLEYQGYLLKRRRATTNAAGTPVSTPHSVGWQCVHGGTSCSIVALVGSVLYVANVGDSSGILCAASKLFNTAVDLAYIGDSDVNSPRCVPTSSLSLSLVDAAKCASYESITLEGEGEEDGPSCMMEGRTGGEGSGSDNSSGSGSGSRPDGKAPGSAGGATAASGSAAAAPRSGSNSNMEMDTGGAGAGGEASVSCTGSVPSATAAGPGGGAVAAAAACNGNSAAAASGGGWMSSSGVSTSSSGSSCCGSSISSMTTAGSTNSSNSSNGSSSSHSSSGMTTTSSSLGASSLMSLYDSILVSSGYGTDPLNGGAAAMMAAPHGNGGGSGGGGTCSAGVTKMSVGGRTGLVLHKMREQKRHRERNSLKRLADEIDDSSTPLPPPPSSPSSFGGGGAQSLRIKINATPRDGSGSTSSCSTSTAASSLLTDGGSGHTTSGEGSDHGSGGGAAGDTCTDTLVITAEHSPESDVEFARMAKARPHPADPRIPELLVVYDESSVQDKGRCPRVFLHCDSSGGFKLTNNGRYYKNVRREWASLVATPPTAKFMDALAFTRSLGDFHLHTYGVSEYPEVQRIDLLPIFRKYAQQQHILQQKLQVERQQQQKQQQQQQQEEAGPFATPSSPFASTPRVKAATATTLPQSPRAGNPNTPPPPPPSAPDSPAATGPNAAAIAELTAAASVPPVLCVVLATDGIWDNWTYEDVTRFVMDKSCLSAVFSTGPTGGAGAGAGGGSGASRVSQSFMHRNMLYSRRNFGNQADNATGIVLYISPSVALPMTTTMPMSS